VCGGHAGGDWNHEDTVPSPDASWDQEQEPIALTPFLLPSNVPSVPAIGGPNRKQHARQLGKCSSPEAEWAERPGTHLRTWRGLGPSSLRHLKWLD
jgi:hypothetical protein